MSNIIMAMWQVWVIYGLGVGPSWSELTTLPTQLARMGNRLSFLLLRMAPVDVSG